MRTCHQLQRLVVLGVLVVPTVGWAQSVARTFPPARSHQIANAPVAGLQSRITVEIDQAPIAVALKTIAREATVKITVADGVVRLDKRVSLRARNMTTAEAFRAVMAGTPVQMSVATDGLIFFGLASSKPVKVQGVVTGRVVDGVTKRGIAGATVQIEGTGYGAQTTDDGIFRMSGIPAGNYTVAIRRIGYGKVTRTVTVGENATVTVDVPLEASANALEQVVVTGTIVQTELKAVPSAITVVTAKQIEERGITRIDQLFRGDIPGLFAHNLGTGATFDEVTMFSRGATALSSASAGLSTIPGVTFPTNAIKTYVDGVELADPKYLSQLDPRSIERIEIVSGPQASTVYGSNAINGVMQIFTKRGMTSKPQVTLNLLSGWVENNFRSAKTPQHDYSGQLNGVEGRLSYNAGASWSYMGPWTPAKRSARTSGFGGARLELPTAAGQVTADLTIRRSLTQNRQYGTSGQIYTDFREKGWYSLNQFAPVGLAAPTTATLTGQTLGLTLSYAPKAWWSHELGIGVDASDAETRARERGYLSPGDTSLIFSQGHTERRSLRYTTTARVPVTSLAVATITAGADGWQSIVSSTALLAQTLTGSLTGTTTVTRQPDHNTGGFVQTQLGVRDRLFLTYGLRAEWNPAYGEEAQPNFAPRYGVAYTQEIGTVTTKVRGSYGRSTRPPTPRYKAARTISDAVPSTWPILSPFYANFDRTLANPELAPEYQQGGEAGLEMYLGTRGSLVITRYNQTVDGLIANPIVDSARSVVPCPTSCSAQSRDVDGYGYWYQYRYVNIGTIRNQGWELQGSVNLGRLTTRGTYSWTKSRTIGVNSKYRASFANNPQYQPGATFMYLPEHTWAMGMTYATGSTTVGLNVTGIDRARNETDEFSFQNFSSAIRLPQNRLNISSAGYVNFNPGYAMADLAVSHRFLSWVEGVLQVQNITDRYVNDYTAGYATMGRQVKAGARLRVP